MKVVKNLLRRRAAEKSRARAADKARLAAGVNPAQLQAENSALKEHFRRCKRIANLAQAAGR